MSKPSIPPTSPLNIQRKSAISLEELEAKQTKVKPSESKPASAPTPATNDQRKSTSETTTPVPVPAPVKQTAPWATPVINLAQKRPVSLREIQEQEALRARDAPASMGPPPPPTTEV